MTRFRWHRGSLADSMTTVVEVTALSELTALIQADWPEVTHLSVKPYAYDARTGWDTYLVEAVFSDGCTAVAGMTDGPLA